MTIRVSVLALILLVCIGESALAQTDTRAVQVSEGIARVACGPPVIRNTGPVYCYYSNGHFWKSLDNRKRSDYLGTVQETVIFVVTKILTGTKEAAAQQELIDRFMPIALDLNKIQTALDDFYAMPENLGVPILYVLQLVAAKEAGMDEVTIQRQTEEFRRLVVEGSPTKKW